MCIRDRYECVKVLNENPNLDFIYSDEDKIDLAGKRRDPHFKSDFAPDSILGSNYICHFEIMRKSIVDKIGGFRVGLELSLIHILKLFKERKNLLH